MFFVITVTHVRVTPNSTLHNMIEDPAFDNKKLFLSNMVHGMLCLF